MKTSKFKSGALAALAALSFAAPVAIATPAAADPPHRSRDYDRHDRRDRDWDNRDDRRDERRAYRDGRRDGRDEYRREWRRGDRASYDERRYWREVSYRDHYRDRRFREPPRGYHYVRDNRTGDYLLVGIATGVILGIIASR